MANTYRVIWIKLNQLVWENAHMVSEFKVYLSASFYLQDGTRQKSTGIDMEQNTVTVNLCIWQHKPPRRFAPCRLDVDDIGLLDRSSWVT